MADNGRAAADPAMVRGVRGTNKDPWLGIRAVQVHPAVAGSVDGAAADEFVEFLRALARECGRFDDPGERHALSAVGGAPVAWSRHHFCLYPVYVERVTIVPDAAVADTTLPVPVMIERAGEWLVAERVLHEGRDHYRVNEPLWRSLFGASAPGTAALGGGLSVNILEVPRAELASGSIDLRPLVLHALAADGSACDRGNPAAQAAIANAFWQTFWATGALRAERGAVFPVAFLPVDRQGPLEFEPPFRERYVSLRRRFFGRTAILAYLNEAMTRSRALLFDTVENHFMLDAAFDPEAHGVTGQDVAMALDELNRTAFVDAHTGANKELFASWHAKEAGARAAARVPAGRTPPPLEFFLALPGAGAEGLVRIHRVVPFSGCAFLSDIVNHTDELRACGTIQDFDCDIVAATNSTFFLNFPEEYATLHSAMNDAVALLVEAGRTVQNRTLRRAAFVLADDGSAQVTTRAGNKLLCDALIYEGESVAATSFTRAAKPFRENSFGPLFFGSVVIGGDIVETFEEIATEIPSNGWLVGDSEAYGGDLEPRRAAQVQVMRADGSGELPVRHAFAAGPMLVQDGTIVPLGESGEEFQPIVLRQAPAFADSAPLARTELPPAFLDCEKRGVAPTRFPYDWDRTRAPRTAIGVRGDGTVVLAVVDGRADLRHSVGVTLAELAQVMLNLGCTSAMNMDGGGSSVMFVQDERAKPLRLRDDLREGVVNLPSDLGGVERLLPVPLMICRPGK